MKCIAHHKSNYIINELTCAMFYATLRKFPGVQGGMRRIFLYVRWSLVIPAGFAGYLFAMYLGMFSYIAMESLCPENEMVSEMCVASYMNVVEYVVFVVFPSLAAILVVTLPALVAPRYKTHVAGFAFLAGSSVAIYMGFSIQAWVPLICAIAAGFITLYLASRAHYVTHNNTFQPEPKDGATEL